jgi:hypothetical protein
MTTFRLRDKSDIVSVKHRTHAIPVYMDELNNLIKEVNPVVQVFSDVVPSPGVLNSDLHIKTQGAPVNSNTDPADKVVMATSLLAGLLTATPAGAINYTLPSGTQMDTACAGRVGVNEAFDFRIINIGAGGVITFVQGSAGFTIVGTATVAANTSATFRVRKTAANTFVLYRL